MSTLLDRIKRRALLVGGPMASREIPMPLPESKPWPEFTCSRPGRTPHDSHHYIHARDGVYVHVGRCAGRDHGRATTTDQVTS